MGGRGSYKLERVVGKYHQINKYKKELRAAIKAESPQKIAETTASLFFSSDYAISNLSKASKLFNFITLNKEKLKTLEYRDREELIAKEWIRLKTENKWEVPKEFDKLCIRSATKLFGGSKNE